MLTSPFLSSDLMKPVESQSIFKLGQRCKNTCNSGVRIFDDDAIKGD